MAFVPRDQEGWAYYPGSAWFNMLFEGGYEFLTPPPMITAAGVEELPSDGARKINSRIAFFYPYTGITPAMCMRLTGIGSQYLISMHGGDGDFLDGDRNYRITLPPDIPESRFWSVILYDDQTRSMLQTVPGKGFFTVLRLYNPLQSFFDKTWRPSEIEPLG